MNSKRILLKWLSRKTNYINYRKNENINDFYERLSKLLVSSGLHFEDLAPSKCYLITNLNNNDNEIDDKIIYELKDPNIDRKKYYLKKYSSFNLNINEYIHDVIELIEFSKNFSFEKEKTKANAILIKIFKELNKKKMNVEIDNTIINNITYEKIFNSLGNISLSEFKEYDSNYEEFREIFIQHIKLKTRDIKEVGIFNPVIIEHDIFEDMYYLCEINPIRTKKNKINFIKYVDNFYDKYGINSDKSKQIFKLEKYFKYARQDYDENFAYFDPFKHFEKYKEKYGNMEKRFHIGDIDFNSFLIELFDFFNLLQYEVVCFQQKNLLNSIISLKSKNRIMTINEYIDSKLKIMENLHNNREYEIRILRALRESDLKKTTEISELSFFKENKDLLEDAEIIFSFILELLNISEKSSLDFIYKVYKNEVKKIIKKYKLIKKEEKDIHNMILDLILFYGDSSKEKLRNPYNNRIREIFLENQNKKFLNKIDDNFEENFIKKYSKKFDKYRPFKIMYENKKYKEAYYL